MNEAWRLVEEMVSWGLQPEVAWTVHGLWRCTVYERSAPWRSWRALAPTSAEAIRDVHGQIVEALAGSRLQMTLPMVAGLDATDKETTDGEARRR